VTDVLAAARAKGESLLDVFREADGLAYEFEGD